LTWGLANSTLNFQRGCIRLRSSIRQSHTSIICERRFVCFILVDIRSLIHFFYLEVFIRNSNVSLSLTLSRNEKVEQHIRRKTDKHTVLRFCVKDVVNSLCESNSCLIVEITVFSLSLSNNIDILCGKLNKYLLMIK